MEITGNIQWTSKWVKGHHDLNTEVKQLTPLEILNIAMDKKVAEA